MPASTPSTTAPLSPHFNIPTEIADLPEDIQNTILAVQEKAGFVPNVFLMLAYRPAEFRAFFAYYDALMERESDTLTLAEKEMLVVTTSAKNHCIYCVVAHGALLRIYSKNPALADQIAINHRTAAISERHKVMLDFALYISIEIGELNDVWINKLEAVGFTRDDIWDIGAVCAFFGLSNRMVSLTGTPPNHEFYMLGRLPKNS